MSVMNPVGARVAWWMHAANIAALLIAATGVPAEAGLLLLNDPNSQHGAVVGLAPAEDPSFFAADIEYAVYRDSAAALNLRFPGLYIYAYQLFNYADSTFPLDTFSMGVNGNQQVANVGYCDPTGGSRLPDGLGEWSLGANSVLWEFNDNHPPSSMVYPGGHSAILYFTSPFGPGRASATVVGGLGADVGESNGPFSPIPEPATGGLLLVGAAALLAAAGARRMMRGPIPWGSR
jgi:hypothetical protein